MEGIADKACGAEAVHAENADDTGGGADHRLPLAPELETGVQCQSEETQLSMEGAPPCAKTAIADHVVKRCARADADLAPL